MRDGMLKCQINQIAALFKVSILKATHRDAARSATEVNVGIAAVEGAAARIGTINRTAPIEAVGTDIADRTIYDVAAARQRQLKC